MAVGRRRSPARGARHADREPAAPGRRRPRARRGRGRGRGRLLDRPLVRRSDRRGRRGGVRAARAAPARPRRARAALGQAPGPVGCLRRVPHRGDGGRGPPASRRARGRARLQDGGHLRRRVPGAHAVPLLHLRGRVRGRDRGAPARRDPRRRSEPDRPGHRVRLRLRARRVRAGGGRVRVGDDQLEPRDGIDGLRHLEPVVLRAADPRGRAGRLPRGAAGRRDRAVRRADAAAPRADPPGGGLRDHGHQPGRDRPGRGPREVRRDPRGARDLGAAARPGAHDDRGARRGHADRLPRRRPPELRAGRPGDGDRLRRRGARGVRADRGRRLAGSSRC